MYKKQFSNNLEQPWPRLEKTKKEKPAAKKSFSSGACFPGFGMI